MGTKDAVMPEARTKALEVEEIADELLVYDLETDRAHRLNAAAALVWRRCDGKTTRAQVSKLLADRFGLPQNPAVVRFALRRLATKRLLVQQSIPSAPGLHPSRRELLKKLGLAATALLPAVSTLVVPPPAYAASCLPRTGCVAGVNDCAPCLNPGGNCNPVWRCCQGACVSPGQSTPCGC